MSHMLAGLLLLLAPLATQERSPSEPVIIVTGEATVRRAPDVAFVTLAVETRAKGPRDAQRQNAEVMTAVQKRLTDMGVAKEALRTIGLRLEQQYDNTGGRRIPRDFLARNTLDVRVDDVSRAGEIADAAVAAGATSIDGIRLDLKDRREVEREALRAAVLDGRARADAVASGAGRVVDRILRIEESGTFRPVPVRPMTMARAQVEAATMIEPGMLEIAAQVTVTVSIK
jgi:uncharacterized protein YggE